MKIELVPLLLGMVIVLLSGAVLADAWSSTDAGPLRERRRRIRAALDRRGEALAGLGFFLIGCALIGRDHWRYESLAILSGTVLLVAGAIVNHRYIRENLLFRGAARRGLDTGGSTPNSPRGGGEPRLRIR